MIIYWQTFLDGVKPSIDPGPSNVKVGVVYQINGVTETGTFNASNTIINQAALQGQRLKAILTAKPPGT